MRTEKLYEKKQYLEIRIEKKKIHLCSPEEIHPFGQINLFQDIEEGSDTHKNSLLCILAHLRCL